MHRRVEELRQGRREPGAGAGPAGRPHQAPGGVHRLVRDALAGAGHAPAADPRRAARTLLALADGLTTHVLVGHLSPREAYEVLHGHLAGLWGLPEPSAGA
ncbi:TetR family transcriptional regulator C-terminal domain-containing protein [Streptomyces diastaticus]